MNAAVINGATGGVGVNLAYELLSRGIPVIAVCRKDSPRRNQIPVHPLVTVVECDLDALETLPAHITVPCDTFYHLAWDGTYGKSRQDEARQQKNVAYTLTAASVAAQLGCTAFVFAGSQSEFGHVEGILRPDLPCHPDTAYGQAKLAAGEAVRARCVALGLRCCRCRILSMYGPYDGAHTMVMQAIAAMLRGEAFACSPGEQVWDYIYAGDVARAFALVGERGHDGAIYCLGSGKTRLLKDYIACIRDAIDPTLPVDFGARAYYPNQVMHLEADITSLTADTGFLPQVSFEEGIRETIAWVRSRQQT